MMKLLPYLLYLLIIAMHEVIWRELTAFYFVALNLPAMVVVIVAIYKSETTAAWFGFLAGVVIAAARPGTMGWQALFLAALAVAVYHIREKLNLESIYSKLLLIVGAVFVHNIASILINGTDRFFYMIWMYCLPSTAYTTVVAWVFFLFKERQITAEKLKSVF
jgi:rod shape-determining protein MreD